MDGRTLVRCGWCALFASIAIGCSPARDFLHQDPTPPGKSYPPATDNAAVDRNLPGTPDAYLPPSAMQAGAVSGPAAETQPAAQSSPPTLLNAPAPLPNMQPAPPGYPQGSASGNPQGSPQSNPGNYPSGSAQNCVQGCQPGQARPSANGQSPANGPPGPAPFQYGLPPGYVYTAPPGDPHLRATPTAVGGRLELAPWEIPAERVVELSKQIDGLNLLNATLVARIRDLEAQGATREQALNEAVRDAERVEEEAAKMRGTIQLSRDEIAILRARFTALEREDIALFERFIAVLRLQLNIPAIERVP